MRRKVRALRRMLALFLTILSLLVCISTLTRILGRTQLGRRRLAAWLMQKHLGIMLRVCAVRLHVRGDRPKPGERFLLLSNHVSYWDILALGSLFPLGFIAKDGIARWPVLGAVTTLCNTIYVSRASVLLRWKSLRRLQENIKDLSYCVFPEGTTTAGTCPKISLWHRGNIAVCREPNVPIWLAGLHYRHHEKQAWIDDDALLPHLFQTLQDDAIDLVIHLQKLEVEAHIPLRQVSIAAWSQTARLCKKAEDDLGSWAPAAAVKGRIRLNPAAS